MTGTACRLSSAKMFWEQVRLEEAKRHKALVRQLKQEQCPKADSKKEQGRNAQVTRAWWMLLIRKERLSDDNPVPIREEPKDFPFKK